MHRDRLPDTAHRVSTPLRLKQGSCCLTRPVPLLPLPVVMLVAPGLRVVLRSAAICKVVAFIYPPFPPVYGILDIDASGLACYEAR